MILNVMTVRRLLKPFCLTVGKYQKLNVPNVKAKILKRQSQLQAIEYHQDPVPGYRRERFPAALQKVAFPELKLLWSG